MKTAAEHALEVESAFLAGAAANLKAAEGRVISGKWFRRADHDRAEALRAAMIDRRMFERERLSRLPHGRGFTVRGYERRFFFGKKLRSVAVASVLCPPGPLLDGSENPPPVTLAELSAHVRELVTDGKAPHLIGVCSPSGFEESVYLANLDLHNVRVVLIAPRPGGGWRVASTGRHLDERLMRIFDPEDVGEKVARVRREIESRRTDLLTGGLSADSMARRLELPQLLVRQAFEAAARQDDELRVSRQDGDVYLYRGAPADPGKENDSMSLAEWIKSLFSREGDEAKKINVLAERRAALSGRLDRMYDDIARLEKREADMVEEGRKQTSQVAKRRLASQIAHLRKDISRCNTSASILSKQINIISTHIHNLELARTGTAAEMPTSEELTEAAVNAEEMLEQLSANDELVTGLEVGLAETSISEDEAAILKELEGDAATTKSTNVSSKSADAAPPSRASGQKDRGPAQAEG
ncbi:hypothetical protein RAS2_32860 [Phycisphaerae bacterium RAS2]|nr:hypothetical protein RAS2_32860 [Phycisphaerae bacterium RAS2]